jgi:transcription elongation GreA/GreB family factor
VLWGLKLKEQLLEELTTQVRQELHSLEEAARAQREFATDSEFKAESKYDTRALEASYLASAEAKRVEELKLDLQILEEVDLKASARLGEVSIGALVELEFQSKSMFYFLIPTAGGSMLNVNGTPVLVVSVFSPIGDALLGLKQGEEFELETPKGNRLYKLLKIH